MNEKPKKKENRCYLEEQISREPLKEGNTRLELNELCGSWKIVRDHFFCNKYSIKKETLNIKYAWWSSSLPLFRDSLEIKGLHDFAKTQKKFILMAKYGKTWMAKKNFGVLVACFPILSQDKVICIIHLVCRKPHGKICSF